MNANEARQIAENNNTIGIEHIIQKIKEAAEKNLFSIEIATSSKDDEKAAKLRRLGYTVDIEEYIDKWTISW